MSLKLAALLILCCVALSETTHDSDKLKIREAELAVAEATAARNAAESAYYRAAQAAEQAQAALQNVLSETGKRIGCEIDPRTADCKPPASK